MITISFDIFNINYYICLMNRTVIIPKDWKEIREVYRTLIKRGDIVYGKSRLINLTDEEWGEEYNNWPNIKWIEGNGYWVGNCSKRDELIEQGYEVVSAGYIITGKRDTVKDNKIKFHWL